MKACDATYPVSDFQHWKAYEGLLPHARAAAELAGDEHRRYPSRPCSMPLGFYLHDQAAYAEAEPLYERALAILEKALGPITLMSPIAEQPCHAPSCPRSL